MKWLRRMGYASIAVVLLVVAIGRLKTHMNSAGAWVRVDSVSDSNPNTTGTYSVCRLYLRGASPEDVTFTGMEARFVGLPNRYVAKGSGKLRWKSNTINIVGNCRFRLNGADLPSYSSYIIEETGDFSKGMLGAPE